MGTVIVAFVCVFALVIAASMLGFKFFEARRRKNVAGMLKVVTGEEQHGATTVILKNIDAKKGSPMEALSKRLNFSARSRAMIQQAGMDWAPSKLLTVMVGAASGGIAVGMIVPIGLGHGFNALVLGAACGAAPYISIRRKRKKRLDTVEEQFPDALDFLARSMRAGHAFSISLEMLGQEMSDPLGLEIRTLSHELNLGAPIENAIKNLCDRVPLLDMRFFASSVMLQKQTGGNLSEILNRLSYVIRERFRLKGQVKASSSHGRMTASILTGLPVVTMIALFLVAPTYLQSMFDDPDGQKIIAGALVAQLIGRFTIKRIVDIKV